MALFVGRAPETAERRPPADRLLDHYKRYFEVVRAGTPALCYQAHRLRYQVYCVENSFENEADFPDGLERDSYDRHSVHALLRHQPSGAFVGTIRLILPKLNDEICALPVATILSAQGIDIYRMLPRRHTAELSRFAIAKSFRRRHTDGRYPDMQDADLAERGRIDRRVAPVMALGLVMGALQMGIEQGISHACAVVEPALMRLLGRQGIELHPIGGPVEYHGLRQPCYIVAEELEKLSTTHPDVWQLISDDGRYRPVPAVAAV